MPQWQGGNNPVYHFGAKLLAALAPEEAGIPEIEVPIAPDDGTALASENGVVAQSIVLRQTQAAYEILQKHQPKRVITFGGDCAVSQAPFAYLNERYDGALGVLWIDAHPDVSTPEFFPHEHAMVLGNLLGEGDPRFAAEVKLPLASSHVMYAGLQETLPKESEILKRLNLQAAGAAALAGDSTPVLDWLKAQKIVHLAIHFDLDVLDPKLFRSLYFAEPGAAEIESVASGKMTFAQVARLIGDVSKQTDIVGFTFAEHLPWDALNLHNFLKALPIFN